MSTATEPIERTAPLGQLADEWLALVQKIEDAGGEIPPELAAEFDTLSAGLGEKADAIAHVLKSLDVQEKALRAKASEFERMARARSVSAERLKAYALAVLRRLQTKRLEGKFFRLVASVAKRAVVSDPTKLPELYWKPPKPREIDLSMVKRDLSDGVDVPGASLVDSPWLKVS